jgi:trichothecene 3-O-acetyltransferase
MTYATEDVVRPAGWDSESEGVVRHDLSGLDLASPRRWVHVSLIYQLEESSSPPNIVDALRFGLGRALDVDRPMAGHFRLDDNGTPWIATTREDAVNFTSARLEKEHASYSDLEKASVAQELLDPALLIPPGDWSASAATPETGDKKGVPILACQANFIRGGLILNMTYHHIFCDSTGMYNFVSRWMDLTWSYWDLEPRSYNDTTQRLDRLIVAHPSPPDENQMIALTTKLSRHKYIHSKSSSSHFSGWQTPITQNVIFHFPRSKIEILKTQASVQDGQISTANAVVALLYKVVTRARLKTFHAAPHTTSDISFPIDLRGRDDTGIKIPGCYLGNAKFYSSTEKLAVREILTDGSLSRIATMIRKATNDITPQLVTDLLEWVEGTDRKTSIALGISTALSMDFGAIDFTSWKLKGLDFGMRPPVAFRHGQPSVNGVSMIYPERTGAGDTDQGLEVLLTLEGSSMERVLQDTELAAYAVPLGKEVEEISLETRRYQLSS